MRKTITMLIILVMLIPLSAAIPWCADNGTVRIELELRAEGKYIMRHMVFMPLLEQNPPARLRTDISTEAGTWALIAGNLTLAEKDSNETRSLRLLQDSEGLVLRDEGGRLPELRLDNAYYDYH